MLSRYIGGVRVVILFAAIIFITSADSKAEESFKQHNNSGILSKFTREFEYTSNNYSFFDRDMASMPNAYNNFRVLPIMDDAAARNVGDMNCRRGGDIGIQQSKTLKYMKSSRNLLSVSRGLPLATKLYHEPFHVIRRRDVHIERVHAGSLETEKNLAVPGPGRGDDSPDANDGSQSTSSPVQIKRVADLRDQVVAGINTPSSHLKDLLLPGTIVHFWASWCGPCEEEIPQLERFYRTHIAGDLEAKGVRLITISNDRSIAPAARFIEKHGTTFPVYLDAEQTTNLAMVGQRSLPSTVMVDANGRFHRLALGKLDWDFPRLPDILAATAKIGPGAGNGTNESEKGKSRE